MVNGEFKGPVRPTDVEEVFRETGETRPAFQGPLPKGTTEEEERIFRETGETRPAFQGPLPKGTTEEEERIFRETGLGGGRAVSTAKPEEFIPTEDPGIVAKVTPRTEVFTSPDSDAPKRFFGGKVELFETETGKRVKTITGSGIAQLGGFQAEEQRVRGVQEARALQLEESLGVQEIPVTGVIGAVQKPEGFLEGIGQRLRFKRGEVATAQLRGEDIDPFTGFFGGFGAGVAISGIGGIQALASPIKTLKAIPGTVKEVGRRVVSGEGFPEVGMIVREEPGFAAGFVAGEIGQAIVLGKAVGLGGKGIKKLDTKKLSPVRIIDPTDVPKTRAIKGFDDVIDIGKRTQAFRELKTEAVTRIVEKRGGFAFDPISREFFKGQVSQKIRGLEEAIPKTRSLALERFKPAKAPKEITFSIDQKGLDFVKSRIGAKLRADPLSFADDINKLALSRARPPKASKGITFGLDPLDVDFLRSQVKAQVRADPSRFIPEVRRLALSKVKAQRPPKEITFGLDPIKEEFLKGQVKAQVRADPTRFIPEIRRIALKKATPKKAPTGITFDFDPVTEKFLKGQIKAKLRADPLSFADDINKLSIQRFKSQKQIQKQVLLEPLLKEKPKIIKLELSDFKPLEIQTAALKRFRPKVKLKKQEIIALPKKPRIITDVKQLQSQFQKQLFKPELKQLTIQVERPLQKQLLIPLPKVAQRERAISKQIFKQPQILKQPQAFKQPQILKLKQPEVTKQPQIAFQVFGEKIRPIPKLLQVFGDSKPVKFRPFDFELEKQDKILRATRIFVRTPTFGALFKEFELGIRPQRVVRGREITGLTERAFIEKVELGSLVGEVKITTGIKGELKI